MDCIFPKRLFDPNLKDVRRLTPLHYCVVNDNTTCAALMLDNQVGGCVSVGEREREREREGERERVVT